jgi:hypothetical protein
MISFECRSYPFSTFAELAAVHAGTYSAIYSAPGQTTCLPAGAAAELRRKKVSEIEADVREADNVVSITVQL